MGYYVLCTGNWVKHKLALPSPSQTPDRPSPRPVTKKGDQHNVLNHIYNPRSTFKHVIYPWFSYILMYWCINLIYNLFIYLNVFVSLSFGPTSNLGLCYVAPLRKMCNKGTMQHKVLPFFHCHITTRRAEWIKMGGWSHLDIVLPEHPPEVQHRVWERTLGRDVGPRPRHSLRQIQKDRFM